MSVFLAVFNAVVPHFRVRNEHTLQLSQGHPFTRVEIDLRRVAAHRPGPATLQLRLLRGRWESYSLAGFRLPEIAALDELLTSWERVNHLPRQPGA